MSFINCCLKVTHFNPRSHEGSDKNWFPDLTLIELFQSTLPRGERPYLLNIQFLIAQFQSTLPRGERPLTASPVNDIWDFNPRSHEGSDAYQDSGQTKAMLFQSTLPRGERLSKTCQKINPVLFQSTLPRGERRITTHRLKSTEKFQSTLPRGERHHFSLSPCY